MEFALFTRQTALYRNGEQNRTTGVFESRDARMEMFIQKSIGNSRRIVLYGRVVGLFIGYFKLIIYKVNIHLKKEK